MILVILVFLLTLLPVAKAPKPPSAELELPWFLVQRAGRGPGGYVVVDRLSGLRVGPLMSCQQARDLAHELDRNRRVKNRLDAERQGGVESLLTGAT